jgi:DNA-binding NtrC family response regulator
MNQNALVLDQKPKSFLILLVDDDENLLLTTSALLEDEGGVLKARDAESALRLLAEHDVHVLCTDYRLPGMDGVQLLRSAYEMDPRLVGILMTGSCERVPTSVAGDPAIFALLNKPYKLEELYKTIRDAARRAALARRSGSFPRVTF